MPTKTKPSIDPAHAKKIADAETAIQRSEKRLDAAKDKKKEAEKDFATKIRRLRKLAQEVTDKGIFDPDGEVEL